VFPTDIPQLEADYRALPAGNAFEPESELAIPRPESVKWALWGIDFDAGRITTVPEEIAGKPEDDLKSLGKNEALDRWALEHGVDALARCSKNECEIVGFAMPMPPLYLATGWQSLQPDRIKRALVSGKLKDAGGIRDKWTEYFDQGGFAHAFRTRDHRLGAWRVAGKTGDAASPRGVKIRYKLVQNGASSADRPGAPLK
jgi:hypothetical protein